MKKYTHAHLLAALRVALLGLAFGLAGPVLGQWQWKDDGGRVHFSDLPPPPGVPEANIIKRPNPAPPPAKAPAAAADAAQKAAPTTPVVDKELEARRQKEEQEAEAKRKAEADRIAKVRAENCSRARTYQQTLDSGVRIVRMDAKGEREVLDDKALAEEAARTRKIIESECK